MRQALAAGPSIPPSMTLGQSTWFAARNLASASRSLSLLTPISLEGLAAQFFAELLQLGSWAAQGPHHMPQKSTSTTRPLRLESLTALLMTSARRVPGRGRRSRAARRRRSALRLFAGGRIRSLCDRALEVFSGVRRSCPDGATGLVETAPPPDRRMGARRRRCWVSSGIVLSTPRTPAARQRFAAAAPVRVRQVIGENALDRSIPGLGIDDRAVFHQPGPVRQRFRRAFEPFGLGQKERRETVARLPLGIGEQSGATLLVRGPVLPP